MDTWAEGLLEQFRLKEYEARVEAEREAEEKERKRKEARAIVQVRRVGRVWGGGWVGDGGKRRWRRPSLFLSFSQRIGFPYLSLRLAACLSVERAAWLPASLSLAGMHTMGVAPYFKGQGRFEVVSSPPVSVHLLGRRELLS